MLTNGVGITRVKTRRKLTQISEDLRRANLQLGEINKVYEKPHPKIGEACQKCIEIISMVENIVWEIRSSI